MLNLQEYLHGKLCSFWKRLIIGLYLNDESFVDSLDEETIIAEMKKQNQNPRPGKLDSEYIQEYLEQLANKCTERWRITPKKDSDRKKKKTTLETSLAHYTINMAQIGFVILKSIKADFPWKDPDGLGQYIVDYYDHYVVTSGYNIGVESFQYSGSGQIDITFQLNFIMEQLYGLATKSYQLEVNEPEDIVVDFSSPNMAKKMHLGHLRSTVIGDTICRFFEFMGHRVHRINHLGDWGRPFAIVIAYIIDNKINIDNATADQLQDIYSKGTTKFKNGGDFQVKVYDIVKRLQEKDPQIYSMWQHICKISRSAYQDIYNELNIKITDMGESFYQDMMVGMVDELKKQDKLREVTGMYVIQINGISNPFILQKSTGKGGNFTYDTSDLAALKHRVQKMKAHRIYYVVDNGQSNHFQLLFAAAKKVGFLPDDVSVQHIGFGVVQSPTGEKLSARKSQDQSSVNIGLKDILEMSYEYALKEAKKNNSERKEEMKDNIVLSDTELEKVSHELSINCIKYFELSHNRTSNYKIDHAKIFNNKGNTAVYVNYAYARSYQIWSKFQKAYDLDIDTIVTTAERELELGHYDIEPSEMKLLMHILKFPEMIKLMEFGTGNNNNLMPHNITDYLYEMSQLVSKFYRSPNCYCLNTDDPENITVVFYNRLLIISMVIKIMKTLFGILGITSISKI